MEIETKTLLDSISESWITLDLLRFASFLFWSLIIEISCSRKKVNVLCTWSTLTIILITGIGGLFALFFVLTTIMDGLINIPIWYYPLNILVICIAVSFFIRGAIELIQQRAVKNLIARSVIFGGALFFFITTIITPTRVNEIWVRNEPARIERTHSTARMYLRTRKEMDISPDMFGWGAEAYHYRNSFPSLIKLKETHYIANSNMFVIISASAERFETMHTNQFKAFMDNRYTLEFKQYLESNQEAIDARNRYRKTKSELDLQTLETMIIDYETKGEMIDTAWMLKDLYGE